MYVKGSHEVMRTDKISSPLFECTLINLQSCQSRNKYTIVVYKSPRCGFKDFSRYIKDLSHFQMEEKLIILGDFNFDVANGQNENFVKTITSLFPTVSRLITPPTTHGNTLLDVSFSSCENKTANILTKCVVVSPHFDCVSRIKGGYANKLH